MFPWKILEYLDTTVADTEQQEPNNQLETTRIKR